MPFKQDYLAADDITVDTYRADGTATERIRQLYGSARQGNMSRQDAGGVWSDFFHGLVSELPHFPQMREAYDTLAINHIRDLATLLRERNLLRQGTLGAFGIAQKMFNLFIKDHWALNTFPEATESCLHLPLDSRVLTKLAGTPPITWKAWTRAQDDDHTRRDYLAVQDTFRAEHERIHRFTSPIEMEQFIWHRVTPARGRI